MKRGMTTVILALLLVSTVWLSSCNLFSGMHSDGKDSNSSVLVADGLAALRRNDYANAAQYFSLAMEHDPNNSEARVGYAHAILRVQGFSLGQFATSFMTAMMAENSSDPSDYEILVPGHWGVTTYTELEQIFTEMIYTLDPVVLGATHGPYHATDVNLNLTVGIFYILRIQARLEVLNSDFSIQSLNKSSPEVAALGLSPSVLAQLPDDFLWILDSLNNQPPLPFLLSMQTDITTAIQRLQTAADHADNDMLQDIADLFKDWKILAYQ